MSLDRRISTPRQVYRAIRAEIESCELAPGRQLSENELAAGLGVSRTPVREALLGLRDDRLIEVVPQLGTFVTPITRAALEDAQFIRAALEGAAVTKAACNADEEGVVALRAIVARQAQTRDADDLGRFYALDDEFHSSLCELGGHAVAWSISQRASGHLNRVRRLSLPLPTYIAEMVDQHEAVVEAVATRDPESAYRALQFHLSMVLHGLPEVERVHPEYFGNMDDCQWARQLAARA